MANADIVAHLKELQRSCDDAVRRKAVGAAVRSVERYPLRITSGAQAKDLSGVGEWLARQIQGFLSRRAAGAGAHDTGVPPPVPTTTAAAPPPSHSTLTARADLIFSQALTQGPLAGSGGAASQAPPAPTGAANAAAAAALSTQLASWTVAQLKEKCRAHRLGVSGTKDVLRGRYAAYLARQGEGVPDAPAAAAAGAGSSTQPTESTAATAAVAGGGGRRAKPPKASAEVGTTTLLSQRGHFPAYRRGSAAYAYLIALHLHETTAGDADPIPFAPLTAAAQVFTKTLLKPLPQRWAGGGGRGGGAAGGPAPWFSGGEHALKTSVVARGMAEKVPIAGSAAAAAASVGYMLTERGRECAAWLYKCHTGEAALEDDSRGSSSGSTGGATGQSAPALSQEVGASGEGAGVGVRSQLQQQQQQHRPPGNATAGSATAAAAAMVAAPTAPTATAGGAAVETLPSIDEMLGWVDASGALLSQAPGEGVVAGPSTSKVRGRGGGRKRNLAAANGAAAHATTATAVVATMPARDGAGPAAAPHPLDSARSATGAAAPTVKHSPFEKKRRRNAAPPAAATTAPVSAAAPAAERPPLPAAPGAGRTAAPRGACAVGGDPAPMHPSAVGHSGGARGRHAARRTPVIATGLETAARAAAANPKGDAVGVAPSSACVRKVLFDGEVEVESPVARVAAAGLTGVRGVGGGAGASVARALSYSGTPCGRDAGDAGVVARLAGGGHRSHGPAPSTPAPAGTGAPQPAGGTAVPLAVASPATLPRRRRAADLTPSSSQRRQRPQRLCVRASRAYAHPRGGAGRHHRPSDNAAAVAPLVLSPTPDRSDGIEARWCHVDAPHGDVQACVDVVGAAAAAAAAAVPARVATLHSPTEGVGGHRRPRGGSVSPVTAVTPRGGGGGVALPAGMGVDATLMRSASPASHAWLSMGREEGMFLGDVGDAACGDLVPPCDEHLGSPLPGLVATAPVEGDDADDARSWSTADGGFCRSQPGGGDAVCVASDGGSAVDTEGAALQAGPAAETLTSPQGRAGGGVHVGPAPPTPPRSAAATPRGFDRLLATGGFSPKAVATMRAQFGVTRGIDAEEAWLLQSGFADILARPDDALSPRSTSAGVGAWDGGGVSDAARMYHEASPIIIDDDDSDDVGNGTSSTVDAAAAAAAAVDVPAPSPRRMSTDAVGIDATGAGGDVASCATAAAAAPPPRFSTFSVHSGFEFEKLATPAYQSPLLDYGGGLEWEGLNAVAQPELPPPDLVPLGARPPTAAAVPAAIPVHAAPAGGVHDPDGDGGVTVAAGAPPAATQRAAATEAGVPHRTEAVAEHTRSASQVVGGGGATPPRVDWRNFAPAPAPTGRRSRGGRRSTGGRASASATTTTTTTTTTTAAAPTAAGTPLEVVCVIDQRERYRGDRAAFADRLARRGVGCEARQLEVGDFLWVARRRRGAAAGASDGDGGGGGGAEGEEVVLDLVIERKRAGDLASSITGGRYSDQKLRLLNAGARRLLYILEGNTKEQSRLAPQALETALWTTSLFDGFAIATTPSIDATVDILVGVTRQFENALRARAIASPAALRQAGTALVGGGAAPPCAPPFPLQRGEVGPCLDGSGSFVGHPSAPVAYAAEGPPQPGAFPTLSQPQSFFASQPCAPGVPATGPAAATSAADPPPPPPYMTYDAFNSSERDRRAHTRQQSLFTLQLACVKGVGVETAYAVTQVQPSPLALWTAYQQHLRDGREATAQLCLSAVPVSGGRGRTRFVGDQASAAIFAALTAKE